MLKHIKDIRSPIAVAQQKQTARKAFGDSSSSEPKPASHARTPSGQESSDNLKSFKVNLEDPAWKVLPAALRKYKINNDDWQNYAMFICYGPQST
jgi:protein STE50